MAALCDSSDYRESSNDVNLWNFHKPHNNTRSSTPHSPTSSIGHDDNTDLLNVSTLQAELSDLAPVPHDNVLNSVSSFSTTALFANQSQLNKASRRLDDDPPHQANQLPITPTMDAHSPEHPSISGDLYTTGEHLPHTNSHSDNARTSTSPASTWTTNLPHAFAPRQVGHGHNNMNFYGNISMNYQVSPTAAQEHVRPPHAPASPHLNANVAHTTSDNNTSNGTASLHDATPDDNDILLSQLLDDVDTTDREFHDALLNTATDAILQRRKLQQPSNSSNTVFNNITTHDDNGHKLSDYELQRMQNIQANNAAMRMLGLDDHPPPPPPRHSYPANARPVPRQYAREVPIVTRSATRPPPTPSIEQPSPPASRAKPPAKPPARVTPAVTRSAARPPPATSANHSTSHPPSLNTSHTATPPRPTPPRPTSRFTNTINGIYSIYVTAEEQPQHDDAIADYKALLYQSGYSKLHVDKMFNAEPDIFLVFKQSPYQCQSPIVLGGFFGTCTDRFGGSYGGQHFYIISNICMSVQPTVDNSNFTDWMETEHNTSNVDWCFDNDEHIASLVTMLTDAVHHHPLRPRFAINSAVINNVNHQSFISALSSVKKFTNLFELSWDGPLTTHMINHILEHDYVANNNNSKSDTFHIYSRTDEFGDNHTLSLNDIPDIFQHDKISKKTFTSHVFKYIGKGIFDYGVNPFALCIYKHDSGPCADTGNIYALPIMEASKHEYDDHSIYFKLSRRLRYTRERPNIGHKYKPYGLDVNDRHKYYKRADKSTHTMHNKSASYLPRFYPY